MGHPSRCQEPTTWQHVTIRGVARRSIFDRQADGLIFNDRVARSVDRGDLRVMVYCWMPNHAHMIVRSPSARLGDAMRDIESVYVRRFNPPRDRRGHLMQGRYWAKPIRTRRYMTAAIAYTDQNPVDAELVSRPADYPLGSARHYAALAGPPWLDRSWVEGYISAASGGAPYSPAVYARVFGTRTAVGARRWFAAAMDSPRPDDSTLDELIAASPEHILRWMDERARTADGMDRIIPLVDDATVVGVVGSLPEREQARAIGLRQRARPAAQLLRVGLLRRLVGASFASIGVQTGQSRAAAQRMALVHEWAVIHDAAYREMVGLAARAALDVCHAPVRADRV